MLFPILITTLLLLVAWAIWQLRPQRRLSSPRRRSGRKTQRREGEALPSHAVDELDVQDAEVPAESMPSSLAELRILTRSDLDTTARETMQRICHDLDEPDPVQRRLATGLDDPDELISVVGSDAGLSADVLRTVNSAAFALVAPITSVPQAVNYLGVNIVKGLVLRATLRRAASDSDPAQAAALQCIWQSACAASAMVRLLALELGMARPSVLATEALFFNVGDVALVHGVPGATDWYREGLSIVERIGRQQAECGLNASVLGASLVRQWQLPASIGDAVEYAYLPLAMEAADHPMTGEPRRENVLRFLGSRIGDRVTYHGLRDIAELDLVPGTEPGLYRLGAHLDAAGLGRVRELIGAPGFRRKANRLLEAFADTRQTP